MKTENEILQAEILRLLFEIEALKYKEPEAKQPTIKTVFNYGFERYELEVNNKTKAFIEKLIASVKHYQDKVTDKICEIGANEDKIRQLEKKVNKKWF